LNYTRIYGFIAFTTKPILQYNLLFVKPNFVFLL